MVKKSKRSTRSIRNRNRSTKKGGASISVMYPSFNVNNSTTDRNSTSMAPTVSLQNLNLSTFLMYDPDAIVPQWLHYLVVNIPNGDIKKGNVIFPYEGPSPPPNTGIHRYIFQQLEQVTPLTLKMEKRGGFDIDRFIQENNLLIRSKKTMRVPS